MISTAPQRLTTHGMRCLICTQTFTGSRHPEDFRFLSLCHASGGGLRVSRLHSYHNGYVPRWYALELDKKTGPLAEDPANPGRVCTCLPPKRYSPGFTPDSHCSAATDKLDKINEHWPKA